MTIHKIILILETLRVPLLTHFTSLMLAIINLLLFTNHYWKVIIQRQFIKEFYLISGSHKSENWVKNIQPYNDLTFE